MLKTQTEMTVEQRSNMRGGEGSVTITHIMDANDLKGKARLIGQISVEPGGSIGLHPHEDEEEIYYILSGKALVTDDGQEQIMGPGDAVLTGGGRSHAIKNIGADALKFVAIILTY